MPLKSDAGESAWIDPDDAPELTADWFERADVYDGDKLIRRGRGRPKAETTKRLISLRLDADIVERFRATGEGWKTRMNAALRDWLDHAENAAGALPD
jgi:uncharacterized protein (DUF4415 family)